MPTLSNFNSKDIDAIVKKTFSTKNHLRSIEDAAQHLAQTIYDYFQTGKQSDFVLVRVFQSMEYGGLLPEIQRKVKGKDINDNTRFLTLLGTYGLEK